MEYGIPYSLQPISVNVPVLVLNGFEVDPVNGYVQPYYRLTDVEGLDGAALRTTVEDRPQREGLITFPFFRGGRYPALVGQIIPRTIGERRRMEDVIRRLHSSLREAGGILRYRPTAAHVKWKTPYVTTNAITDTERNAAPVVQGDGLAPEGSFGIWEATTNLLTNGGLESNATGWNVWQSTIARIATRSKFGVACGRCTVVGTPVNYSADQTAAISGATAGRLYSFGAWVYAEGSVIGKTLKITIREEGGATGTSENSSNFVLAAGWNRVYVTRQIAQNDRTFLRCLLDRASSIVAAEYFDFDGAQLELQPLATPYVETNGATATRNAATLTGDATLTGGPGQIAAPHGPLRDQTGWVAMKFRAGWASTEDPHGGNIYLFNWENNAGTDIIDVWYDPTDDKFKLRRKKNASDTTVATPAANFLKDSLHTVVAAWTPTGLSISLDGAAFATAADTGAPNLVGGADYAIGHRRTTGLNHIDSEIFWVAMGYGTLVAKDVTTLNALVETTGEAGYLSQLMRGGDLPLGDGAAPALFWPAINSTYLVPQERRVAVQSFEPIQVKGGLIKEFRLGYVAPEPLIQGEPVYTATGAGTTPFIATIENSLDGQDTFNPILTGLDPLWPIIKVTAGAAGITNVDLQEDTSGKIVRLLALGLTTGQFVTVDMRNETVVKSDGTDLSGKIDPTVSEFWSVDPGNKPVSLRNLTGQVSAHIATYRLVFAG